MNDRRVCDQTNIARKVGNQLGAEPHYIKPVLMSLSVLPEEGHQEVLIQRRRRKWLLCNFPERIVCIINANAQADITGRSQQVGLQLIQTERPSGIGDPFSLLKIDVIEGCATTSPCMGASP